MILVLIFSGLTLPSQASDVRARFESLAFESQKLEKPCQAFAKTVDKVLATSIDTPHFKTHVLTEAAISQARSYPGTSRAAARAFELARTELSSAADEPWLSLKLTDVVECVPRKHQALWSKTLISARHFKFSETKRAVLRKAVLEQVKREAMHAMTLSGLMPRLELVATLIELGYVPDTTRSELVQLQKQMQKIIDERKPQQRVFIELHEAEKARQRFVQILHKLT